MQTTWPASAVRVQCVTDTWAQGKVWGAKRESVLTARGEKGLDRDGMARAAMHSLQEEHRTAQRP